MSENKDRYFISYSREDEKEVLSIAERLRSYGVSLFIDKLDIRAGERWDTSVESALLSCNGIIVFLSAHSIASNNVLDEISYALENNKHIVPVLISVCTIPLRLQRLQYIDFTEDADGVFNQLLGSLDIQDKIEELERKELDFLRNQVLEYITPGELFPLFVHLKTVLDENASNPEFDTSILAAKMGYSRRQMGRVIQRITGMRSEELLWHFRLGLAVELYEGGDIPISEIAEKAGFKAVAHLRKKYLENMGSPFPEK